MTEPQTEAGRRLLADWRDFDPFMVPKLGEDLAFASHVVAIEAEARAQERQRIADEVDAMAGYQPGAIAAVIRGAA